MSILSTLLLLLVPYLLVTLTLAVVHNQFDTSNGYDEYTAGIRRSEGDNITKCTEGFGDTITPILFPRFSCALRPLQVSFPFALSSPRKVSKSSTFLPPGASLISSSIPMDFGSHHVLLINVSTNCIAHCLHHHLPPSYKPQLPSSLSSRIVTSSHRFLSSRV